MIEAIQRVYDAVLTFFQGIWDWITTGIYDFGVWAFAKLVEYLVWKSLEFKLWALDFGWDAAKVMLADLDFSNRMQSAFDLLPASSVAILNALGVPQCITLVVTAALTRFLLRFIPGAT